MDAKRPNVLVLLAAFNGCPWISLQLQTILNQMDVDVRVVVSDDGSSDETAEEVARFPEHVTLVSPPIPTGSAAQNFLWLIRSHPPDGFAYVALADQDDLWHERKLASACSTLTMSGAAAYSCAVTAFWPDGAEKLLCQSHRTRNGDFLFEGAGQGCTYVLEAAFYGRLRAFLVENEEMTKALHYHDWAIYAVARCWGAGWAFDSQSLVRYRQHQNNDTGAKVGLRGVAKRLRLILQGWYAAQIRTVTAICVKAAPFNLEVRAWSRLMAKPRGFARTFEMTAFCFTSGRRRATDNAVLMFAVLLGRI